MVGSLRRGVGRGTKPALLHYSIPYSSRLKDDGETKLHKETALGERDRHRQRRIISLLVIHHYYYSDCAVRTEGKVLCQFVCCIPFPTDTSPCKVRTKPRSTSLSCVHLAGIRPGSRVSRSGLGRSGSLRLRVWGRDAMREEDYH